MTMPSGTGWTAAHLVMNHPLATCAVCLCIAAVGGTVAATEVHEPTVVLTFDDATRSQIELGLPVAKEFDIEGTLYVPTMMVLEEGEERGWYMTADDVLEFQEAGWEIGSHTTLHENLVEQTPSEALNSMTVAAAQIRGITGNMTGEMSFAYPFGSYDPTVAALSASLHDYSVDAWSDARGMNVPATFSPHEIHRWDVGSQESVDYACQVIGALGDDQTFVVIVHDIVETDPQDYQITIEQYRQLLTCITDAPVSTKTLMDAANSLRIVQKYGEGVTAEVVAATPQVRHQSSSW